MKSQKKAFQNIIAGVDFSQYSRLAVDQAKLLAKNFNAKLTLVYARGPWLFVDGFKDRAIFETAEMEQLMRKFYKIEKRSKHRILVQSGSPAEVLNKLGSSVSKPLIVIGSQGSGAIGRFLLGSNAEKVALTSPFPVWIHKGPKTVIARKVLVPMDLSNKNQRAMEFLNQWFDPKKTSLSYLFVRPFSPIGWQTRAYEVFYNLEQRNEQLLKKFQQSHPDAEVYVAAGDPAQQIHRTLSKYDLIVMTPHNKYGDSQLFGKVTTKVIRLAQKPILIVKATKTVSMQKEKTEKEGARQSEPSLQLHS